MQQMHKDTSVNLADPSDLQFNSEVRRRFVSKVYSILTVQLLITTVVSLAFACIPHVKSFIFHHPFVIYIPILFISPIYFALICCKGVRRSYPLNFVLLGFLTLGYSVILGILAVLVATSTLITGYVLTSILFLSMTILARTNLIDMTKFWMVLFASGIILSVLMLIAAIFSIFVGIAMKPFNLILVGFAILLLLAYIVFDTQLILGGRSIELNEEDYIYAVVCLYCDFVDLLIQIIILLDAMRQN